MTRRWIVRGAGVVVILIVAGLCRLAAQDGRLVAPPRLTLKVGDRDREYFVFAPPSLSRDRPVPVVFVFHGGNGDALGTLRLTQLSAIAEREQFLIVAPQGVGRGWNDGRVTQVSEAHRENVDDLAFFDTLLEKLTKDYRIDPRRVFATGISNGGIFSHFLAAQRSTKLAAIAPVVGGIAEPFDQRFQPTSPVSVLMIQGTADPLVPYDGGKIAGGDGKDRGSVIATDRAVALWVAANRCQPEPTTRLLDDADPQDGCRTTAKMWTGGRGGSEVWLYRVDGGGHTWPGGIQYAPRVLIGRVTHDFTSQAIWDFFKTHPQAADE